LKFSRDDESEADTLGYRYAGRAGFDLREMPRVFRTLGGLSTGSDRLPGWLATHPDPLDRARVIEARLSAEPPPPGTRNRDPYLRAIEHTPFGENPREGFFRGSEFLHPDLRFRLEFPEGFKTSNQKTAVAALSPSEDAVVVLTLQGTSPPADAAQAFSSRPGMETSDRRSLTVGGLPALSLVFQATSGQQRLAGRALFVAHGGKTFRLLGYTAASRLSAYDRVFRESLMSFAPLRDPSALEVQPRRIALVRLEQELSVEEFDRRYPSTVPRETVALINQAFAGDALGPGLVKRVVGGPAREQEGRP